MSKIKIETYHVTTVMGKLHNIQLHFLTESELTEFNNIGYTGSHLGVPMDIEDYLNSLNKGTFEVTQTKWDDGTFVEGYTIVRATIGA